MSLTHQSLPSRRNEELSTDKFKINPSFLPRTIYVADNTSLANLRKLSLNEFEEMISRESEYQFHWTEEILSTDKDQQSIYNPASVSESPTNMQFNNVELCAKFNELLEERNQFGMNYDSFVFCKIGENLGRGVVARMTIPKNTVIGSYTGNLLTYQELAADPLNGYNIICRNDIEVALSAQNYGNITRFINDFPTPEELTKYYFADIKRDDIATVNVEMRSIWINDFFVTIFVTKREINPGEQLGVSYTTQKAKSISVSDIQKPGYWEDRNRIYQKKFNQRVERRFFTTTQQLISRDQYVPYQLEFEDVEANGIIQLTRPITFSYNNNADILLRKISGYPQSKLVAALERNLTTGQRKLYFGFDPCEPKLLAIFNKIHTTSQWQLNDTQELHPLNKELLTIVQANPIVDLVRIYKDLNETPPNFAFALYAACQIKHFAVANCILSFIYALRIPFHSCRDRDSKTILHIAVEKGSDDSAYLFIQHYLPVFELGSTDVNARSILHAAAMRENHRYKLPIIKLILDALKSNQDRYTNTIELKDKNNNTFYDYLTQNEIDALGLNITKPIEKILSLHFNAIKLRQLNPLEISTKQITMSDAEIPSVVSANTPRELQSLLFQPIKLRRLEPSAILSTNKNIFSDILLVPSKKM